MAQVASAFTADPELVAALEKRSRPVRLGPDGILFRQGDPPAGIFILQKGTAILTMRSRKRIVMQTRAGAGSLFGIPAVIGDRPYSLAAEVLEGSEVIFLSRADFADVMETQPGLSLKILELLAAEVRFARQALSDR